MTQPLTNFQARDLDALLHPYGNAVALRETGALVIERGEGVHVYDQAGRPYIEAMSGLWCAGLGFGNAELVEAARVQMERLPYYHLFGARSHEPAVELAEKIKALAPGRMARVFYQSSGSEANDTQVKFAWYYNNALGRPKKKTIVSRIKAYHGVTIVAASLTGLPNNHRDFDLPVPGIRHLSTPHHWKGAEPGESEEAFAARLAAEFEALVEAEGPETIAAFIAEPVMGAGGLYVPPKGYFEAMSAVCREHDILMISDEVICGFGRTGQWFGAETLGFEPNALTIAKQLTARLPAAVGGGARRRHGRGDRGQQRPHRHPRPRLHLRRPPGRLRRRGQGAGDLPAHRRARPRPRAGAAVRGPPRPAGASTRWSARRATSG